MSLGPQVPVEVVPPASAETVAWRLEGVLKLTVVVKATLTIVHEGVMELAKARPVMERDVHHDQTSLSSLSIAHDIAPHLPDAGIIVLGHAYAPPGQPLPALTARFAVIGEAGRVDKSVHVYGDRTPDRPRQPEPFQKMPLLYERAVASEEENPVGITAKSGRLPNLVDPTHAGRPGGFGGVSRYWPVRRTLRGRVSRRVLEGAMPDIPSGFDWSYFHAAPRDQRMPYLRGDEWLVLDRLHATLPRVSSRLPGISARARFWAPGDEPREVMMSADTMLVDVDRQVCHLVWRGRIGPLTDDALGSLHVEAGLETADRKLVWPETAAATVAGPAATLASEGAATSTFRDEPSLDDLSPDSQTAMLPTEVGPSPVAESTSSKAQPHPLSSTLSYGAPPPVAPLRTVPPPAHIPLPSQVPPSSSSSIAPAGDELTEVLPAPSTLPGPGRLPDVEPVEAATKPRDPADETLRSEED